MLNFKDFSAVIFDMDGLVLDTESTYVVAWQRAANTMGYEFSEPFCRSLSGLHYKDIELKMTTLCGINFDLQKFNQLSAVFWREHVQAHGISIKHGFNELHNMIDQKQIAYCLATNSRAINAYECLEIAGIKEFFSIIITRDDVQHGKPEPDIFLKSAELLQVPISQCLVLEDSHAGIVAAVRAGAISVFVPSTDPPDPLAADLCDVMMKDLAETHIIFQNSI